MEKIIEILSNISDKKTLKIILSWLFTPQELISINERIEILQKLKKWDSQRKISQDLWVSVATVTRGNRVLKYENPEITNYI